MMKVAFDDLTCEERAALSKRVLVEAIHVYFEVMLDRLGGEYTLRALEPYGRMSAAAFNINMHEMFGIEGTDLQRIGDVSEIWDKINVIKEGENHDFDKRSDKIIRAGFLNCPYKSAPKELCIWAHE